MLIHCKLYDLFFISEKVDFKLLNVTISPHAVIDQIIDSLVINRL